MKASGKVDKCRRCEAASEAPTKQVMASFNYHHLIDTKLIKKKYIFYWFHAQVQQRLFPIANRPNARFFTTNWSHSHRPCVDIVGTNEIPNNLNLSIRRKV